MSSELEIIEIIKQLAKIEETLRHLEKKTDLQHIEIQNLHRENSKQSEEIRDAAYLADGVKTYYSDFKIDCSKSKACNLEMFNEVEDKIESIYEKELKPLREELRKALNNKFVLVVQTIVTTFLVISAIVAAFMRWVTFGG